MDYTSTGRIVISGHCLLKITRNITNELPPYSTLIGMGSMYGKRRSLTRLSGVDQYNSQYDFRRNERTPLDKIKF